MTTGLTFGQRRLPLPQLDQLNLGQALMQQVQPFSGAMAANRNATNMMPVQQPQAQPMAQPMAQGQGPSFQFQDLNRAFQLDPRNTLANTLMQQGMRGGPVRTPLEGIGRLSQSLVAAMLQKRGLDRLEQQETARQSDLQAQQDAITATLPANLQSMFTGPATRQSLNTLQQFQINRALQPPKDVKTADIVDGGTLNPMLKGSVLKILKTNEDTTDFEILQKAPVDPKTPNQKEVFNRLTNMPEFASNEDISNNENLIPLVKGMRISLGSDGNFELVEGLSGQTESKLSKPTQKALEGDIIEEVESVAKLNDLLNDFKPEFFEYETRIGGFVQGLKEKFQASTPEEAAQFQDYRDFISRLSRTSALEINKLYGAALSQGENARAATFIPSPNDAPSVAQSKLQQAVREAKRGLARKSYILKNGLLPKVRNKKDPNKDFEDIIPLTDIDNIIENKGVELAQQFKQQNPQATEDQVDSFVLQELQKEFKLVF
mgnify:CR=1 FL=1